MVRGSLRKDVDHDGSVQPVLEPSAFADVEVGLCMDPVAAGRQVQGRVCEVLLPESGVRVIR